MRYELLLFDADQTLFDFDQSQADSLKKSIIDLGFDFDETFHLDIYSEVNSKIWKEFEEGLITQEKLKVERFKRFGEKANMKFDAKKFAKLYMHHLAHSSILYDDSIKLLEKLKDKCRLAIITNGLTKVQEIRIKKSKIAHYFETIVISEEIQIAKPDAEIFDHTLKILNYKDKTKVLMIGDNLNSDIKGGVNANIDTCWFNPNKKPNKTDIKPVYEISELLELLSIV